MKKFLTILLVFVVVSVVTFAQEQVVEEQVILDDLSLFHVEFINIETGDKQKITLLVPLKDLGETTVLENFSEEELNDIGEMLELRLGDFMVESDNYYYPIDLNYKASDLNNDFLGYYHAIILVEE